MLHEYSSKYIKRALYKITLNLIHFHIKFHSFCIKFHVRTLKGEARQLQEILCSPALNLIHFT